MDKLVNALVSRVFVDTPVYVDASILSGDSLEGVDRWVSGLLKEHTLW